MEQEKIKCPYCGEEILAVAKKCKHCGEWLEEEALSDDNQEYDENVYEDESCSNDRLGCLGRILVAIAFVIVSVLIFVYGGWNIVWGHEFTKGERALIQLAAKESSSEIVTNKEQSFIVDEDALLVRVNEKFYGVIKEDRFFDSPLIQWIMLCGCIGLLGASIKVLIDDE